MTFQEHLRIFPFIAIMRGISPQTAFSCVSVLAKKGFRIIETPLNSPEPLATIEKMASYAEDLVVGAGTVTSVEQVVQVKAAGGRIIVSPNCNTAVIEETKKQGLISVPGVATPTEAFAALAAGADALKLFPAEILPPPAVKALLAVLPRNTLVIPVGGIDAGNWQPYYAVGASGFGLGSSLYTPATSAEELGARADRIRKSWEGSRK